MTIKRIVLAAALTLTVATSGAKAEVLDLATVKCSDLATMSDEDGTFFFVWLHGYFGGMAGDTTMDTSAMGVAGEKIGRYCAENPDVGVLSAVQQALGE